MAVVGTSVVCVDDDDDHLCALEVHTTGSPEQLIANQTVTRY